MQYTDDSLRLPWQRGPQLEATTMHDESYGLGGIPRFSQGHEIAAAVHDHDAHRSTPNLSRLSHLLEMHSDIVDFRTQSCRVPYSCLLLMFVSYLLMTRERRHVSSRETSVNLTAQREQSCDDDTVRRSPLDPPPRAAGVYLFASFLVPSYLDLLSDTRHHVVVT